MFDVLIGGVVALITSGISSWITYISTKKRYMAETKSVEVSNLDSMLDVYKKLIDDTNDRVDLLLKRNDELELKNMQLEKDLSHVKSQMISLVSQICVDLSCLARMSMTKEEINCRFSD